jgi:tryptophan-rich sensory protein
MVAEHRKWFSLALFLAVTFAAGGVGGLLMGGEPGAWYAGLRKPAFTPPGWVIGAVWQVLYATMAVAAWRVWRRAGDRPGARFALGLYAAQLALNAAWSGLFFGLQRPGLAFAELCVLWAAIAATTALFFRHSAVAGALMLPYLGWVSFAGALNAALWRLNA